MKNKQLLALFISILFAVQLSAIDIISSMAFPDKIVSGETFDVTVNYNASSKRKIKCELKLSVKPWTEQASKTINIDAGSKSEIVTLDIGANAPSGSNYTGGCYITTVNGGWYENFSHLTKSSVSVVSESQSESSSSSPSIEITDNRAYNGTPISLPGTIEAEEYDKGGEGIAYHDKEAENLGHTKKEGDFRTNEGVDIEPCNEGGYNIGWAQSGEYVEYTVNVDSDGYYDIDARVATNMSGNFKISFQKSNTSKIFNLISTGGWQTWKTLNQKGLLLKAGKQIMRIEILNGAFNINKLSFSFSDEVAVENTNPLPNININTNTNTLPNNPGPILNKQHYDDATSRFVPPAGYKEVARYKFGKAAGNNIQNLTDLSKAFVPYLGDLANGGRFAGTLERARYKYSFEQDLHVITENSIKLYVKPGENQALDTNGNITQPSVKYAKNQWMRGSVLRVKDKFHKNSIFVTRVKFPHATPGIFPAAWIVGGYSFWPLEIDIFESWTTTDASHPMFQTDTGNNHGGTMIYDNNWVTYQTEHRYWRHNNKGQIGHIIGKTDNIGNWIELDAFEDENKNWNKRDDVTDDIGIDYYTTRQVRVGGLDFSTSWVDHASGVLDDPNSEDPSKGIATWWLGKSKSRESHYWLNGFKPNTKMKYNDFSWKENDTLSFQVNMTTNRDTGKPSTFPQWLEIEEMIVYEPISVAFDRTPTEPVNDARVSSSPKYVKEGDSVTITVQWRNVKPNHTVDVYWADFWEKDSTKEYLENKNPRDSDFVDNGALWANKKITSFIPVTQSGKKEITFTITKAMLSSGDTTLAFNHKNKEHGYITAVIDKKEIRNKDELGIKKGKFAKSLILQDGIFYGTSDKNLIKDYEQY